jgi:hypothetical protein
MELVKKKVVFKWWVTPPGGAGLSGELEVKVKSKVFPVLKYHGMKTYPLLCKHHTIKA